MCGSALNTLKRSCPMRKPFAYGRIRKGAVVVLIFAPLACAEGYPSGPDGFYCETVSVDTLADGSIVNDERCFGVGSSRDTTRSTKEGR